jgi:hypothetical protein
MLLRHACPGRVLASIQRGGIDPAYCQGRLPVAWLHSPSKTPWAGYHVVRRHGGRVERVVVIEVDVPRSWMMRWGKGLWHTGRIIPPERFRRIIRFGEVSASPVSGG